MPLSFAGESRLSNLFSSNDQNSVRLIVERDNLICLFKLVIKDLLNTTFDREQRLLEKEYFPLKHFFIVFEHILYHGYNGKKTFPINTASNRKDLWPLIELISKKTTDNHMTEILTSIKEMTHLRTALGRVRAWLRLALMQKHLSDYFKILIDQRQELTELYDSEAILLSDESILIPGLLLGLNALDVNLCLKELTLDTPIEPPIHYSLYLQERRILAKNSNANESLLDEQDNDSAISNTGTIDGNNVENSNEQRLSSVLDQKHYLEELNNNLQRTIKSLQDRIQNLEQTNKTLVSDLDSQKSQYAQLQEELKQANADKEQIQVTFQRKIETINADISAERETFKNSRSGFDLIYSQLEKKYNDEKESKQKLEQSYQGQISQNTEHLQVQKTMGQDIQTKIDLLDQLNQENSQLNELLKVETNKTNEKEKQLQTLTKDNQMLRETVNELENNLAQMSQEAQKLSSANEALSRVVVKSDSEKTSLETDLRVEQEFHERLQTALTNEKEKVSQLQFDLHDAALLKQKYEEYKRETTNQLRDYEARCHEQDKTIQDLALKLEASITREDEFREKDGLRSSVWMKDVKVKECCQCKKEFTPLRRKHHCRSCGQIFCESCASSKIALASSHKPVRVCDCCRDRALAQCAVNTP